MDRNIDAANMALANTVALLAEGVDRNLASLALAAIRVAVALLAEGVDRNYSDGRRDAYKERSPSSRRAWIEIPRRAAAPTGEGRRPPRGGRG